MEEKYLIKIDQVCSICDYRNKMDWRIDTKKSVVACGRCGHLIDIPDDMTKEEKKVMQEIINNVLKEEKARKK